MISLRRSGDRGHFDHGWLKTHHTFSFGEYHDPQHMRFRSLRVMNEDWVAPGRGFGMHPHQDMEIVTYVLEGSLKHIDSMGNTSTLNAGDFQRMTAGTGVTHSEVNPSSDQEVHLYQIWLFPEAKGLQPSYQERRLVEAPTIDGLQLVAARRGDNHALTIHQDVSIYLGSILGASSVSHELAPGRHAWLQVLRGTAMVGDTLLMAGDGAAFSDEPKVTVRGTGAAAEIMLFDLA
ncbi:MAG: pirin family protein [Phycisphaerales bacterium]|nr:pirin family protein [Phycisphaerales bacterium]